MMSLKRRLLAKTFTYKGLTFVSSFVAFGITTGSVVLATGAATGLIIVNTLIYLAHEAAWNKVSWGRENGQDTAI
jgi:uncharacterized membrane protein